MTALPEAKLAREAEICYATLALVTDFDTWHETEESVSVELVIGNLTRNVERVARDYRQGCAKTDGGAQLCMRNGVEGRHCDHWAIHPGGHKAAPGALDWQVHS